MNPSALAFALLVGIPDPPVSRDDLLRFTSVAIAADVVNQTERRRAAISLELEQESCDPWWWDELLTDQEQRLAVWRELAQAHGLLGERWFFWGEPGETERMAHLEALRKLLGREDFYRGRMPSPLRGSASPAASPISSRRSRTSGRGESP